MCHIYIERERDREHTLTFTFCEKKPDGFKKKTKTVPDYTFTIRYAKIFFPLENNDSFQLIMAMKKRVTL